MERRKDFAIYAEALDCVHAESARGSANSATVLLTVTMPKGKLIANYARVITSVSIAGESLNANCVKVLAFVSTGK